MKGLFEFLANLVKVLLVVLKGDQPKRDEIESATKDLEKEDKELHDELNKEIAKKKQGKKGANKTATK